MVFPRTTDKKINIEREISMREYTNLTIVCPTEEMAEIAIAYLEDFAFESFDIQPIDEHNVELHAYILATEWRECRDEALSAIAPLGLHTSEHSLEDENWNATWEAEGFERVEIDDLFVIRAPHHTKPTDPSVIDIVVSPQMSFGSGHHHTTRMMCRMIHSHRPQGRVLDVGCGTGVLSIAALKCGAERVDAVDIDPWSTASTQEAAMLNDVADRTEIILGTVECIEGRHYDTILANINRNIILNDLPRYAAALNSGGILLLSGFLEGDVTAITEAAEAHGLEYVDSLGAEEWRCLKLKKTAV